MGKRQVQQDAFFYEFALERHVPEKHLLRAIDRFVELNEVRAHLAPFYSETGRPSIDPELHCERHCCKGTPRLGSVARFYIEITAGCWGYWICREAVSKI
jgi:transposase